MVAKIRRTYTELMQIPTYKERFEYLKLGGGVCDETFGYDRYMNQAFYKSSAWRRVRDIVLIRDNGMDMGLDGYPIKGKIIIHHMIPVTPEDFDVDLSIMTNPEYLICVSMDTHNAIHYGDFDLIAKDPILRTAGDTCPWRLTGGDGK